VSNKDDRGLCEVFVNTGRFGGCASQSEAIGRLISLSLKCGISIEDLIEQLSSIRCQAAIRKKMPSCPEAICSVLKSFADLEKDKDLGVKCPDCGQLLDFTEGCKICKYCGFSKCS